MPRIIFHIDVNSAFVSWLGAKLVREGKPDIRLVPSVVSGDPNDRRSIVTAASIPAKKLGIRVPEPVSMALRKCPNLVIMRGDWEWYKQCSEVLLKKMKMMKRTNNRPLLILIHTLILILPQ